MTGCERDGAAALLADIAGRRGDLSEGDDARGGESVRDRIVSVPCCGKLVWSNIRDLGTANALEFDLGRCAGCGQYVMHIYYQGTSGYWVVAAGDAAELLEAEPGPGRKALLNHWLEKVEFWERS